ncbi:ABC transporter substrate-binding protein [Terasakiella pusilla]|jgi:branched-chain amino acid transport system substrate-binding protein|uniref:ABC transporter substrate-binding protein n=1 Tax=Terasakiella pusilla TaxID=64973 RepID=UPI000491992C|nr:ABC transporter substrate-binding protein [Terasakiella pusilla]
MITRRQLIGGVLGGVVAAMTIQGAQAADTIKIGEINSYSKMPAFTVPYRNGWQLALEEINAAGGINGKLVEVISKDDAGKPGEAVTAANELVSKDNVHMLMGTFFSHIGLAVSDFALQKEVVFVAAEPLTDAMTWSKGHDYVFRVRPNVTIQASILANEAAKLPAKRWATIAPNYEYGKSSVEAFKAILSEKRPDIEWVDEQWPTLFKMDAGSTVQALLRSEPEAIFNVTFGSDLTKFVREGTTRKLFDGREVVSMLTGEPEYLDALRDEAPEGWLVTGYPWYSIDTPEHNAFRSAYEAKFDDYPRLGSIVGYATMKATAAIIANSKSLKSEDLIAGGKGVEFDTPMGKASFRAVDHQATLGAYVGRTALKDDKGIMVDWKYEDGANHLPDEATTKELRGM